MGLSNLFNMLYVFSFIFGSIAGSFLNSVIYRTYTGKSFLIGRSFCPACKKTLKWYELIPVISFLIQSGKCRGCSRKISPIYPLIEIISGLLTVGVVYFGISNCTGVCDKVYFLILRDLFAIYVLIVLFVYDLRWKLVPDKIIIPAIGFILIYNILLYLFNISYISIIDMIIGVLIGGGFFAAQFWISKGRWVGGGDVRMGALMGVILGWSDIVVALVIAYVLGSFISMFLLLWKRIGLQYKIPFVPFLALSTLITMYWGEYIVQYYFNLVNVLVGI